MRDIENLQLLLGSRNIPASTYSMNVADHQTLRSYVQSSLAMGFDLGGSQFAGAFSRVAFQNTKFITVFDLTR